MNLSICIPLTFLLLAPMQAFAQESSIESKVRALEDTVQLLERRMASLEAELREQSAPASIPSGKENWRKLEKGMSEADVERLLGSPSKIDAYGPMTIWHYGGGSVRFDGDSRTVNAWFEP
jgi:hypothetical protein